jgi:SAM-dependent methyltransferase
MTDDRLMADNLKLWEEWTDVHETSDFYDLKAFIEGRNPPGEERAEPGVRLRRYELEEVGDVSGKDLLHLQCHFGIDTLSWARLGARVTGADFSPKAIALARRIAGELGIDATFVESNVYRLPEVLQGDFDIVYTSRGVLGWLPRIEPWAEVVAHFVRPGGIFYITEVHPALQVMDEEAPVGVLRPSWPYFEGDALSFKVEGSYADRDAKVEAEWEHGWNHGLGEIVTALARNGLVIELLTELPHLYWPSPFLARHSDGTYGLPEDAEGEFPMFFSLRASKPA